MTVVLVTVVIVTVVIITLVTVVLVTVVTVVIERVVIVTVVILVIVTVAVVRVLIVISSSKNNLTHRQPMRFFQGSFLRCLAMYFFILYTTKGCPSKNEAAWNFEFS